MGLSAERLIPPAPLWAAVAFALICGGCRTPSEPEDPLAKQRSVASFPPPRMPWLAVDKPQATQAESNVVRTGFQKPAEPAPPPRAAPPPLPIPKALPSEEEAAAKLSLDQIVNAVLVSDPKLRAGFEAINQANADALTASLRPNPTLFNDVQLLPLTRPFSVTQQGGPPQQDIQLGYPIDWFVFGKRAANMAAAAEGVKVSRADFEDRVRLRVTDAITGYYDVLEAKALVELAKQDVANLERVEGIIQKGVGDPVGTKAAIDLDRIRLVLLQSRQTLREAERSLSAAKASLRAILGRKDSDPAFDVAGSLDTPLTAAPPENEDAFLAAMKNRPDIASLQFKGAQARANMLVEKRNAYPSITPGVLYTRQYQTQAIGFPDANSWGASVSVTLPIFDRNQGNRAKAASLLSQNQFEYQSALADLRAEIESVSAEYRAARLNAEAAAGEQLTIARSVLERISAAYGLGTRGLLELLDAQRDFRDTYRAYINSRANYWRAVYKFSAAIGQQVAK